MINEIRDNIIMLLSQDFNEAQLKQIDLAVAEALQGYKIEKDETLPVPYTDPFPIEVREFLARKKVKGCSDATIKHYAFELKRFCQWAPKDIKDMTDLDILIYFDYLQSHTSTSNLTLDGNRAVLSSFYSFLQGAGKIARNPMKGIDPIKYISKVRNPLSDMEMERIRSACRNEKERALIETFYSTGARISEIIGLNKDDIDMVNRRAIITGKGNKQRYIFFNAKAIFAIRQYLSSRTDEDPALFVKERVPHSRLTQSGVEDIIKKIGVRAGLDHPLFPHLFRHTFATDMLSNGATVTEVSRMLGHERIETTLLYAKESIEDLSISHKKHIA